MSQGLDKIYAGIDRLLLSRGFVRCSDPLTINDMSFDVSTAYLAPSSASDLIIVLDLRSKNLESVRRETWTLERVASALDHAESRRSLTTVAVHDPDSARIPLEAFLRFGRVLLVSGPASVERELAPILPLQLLHAAGAEADVLAELMETSIRSVDPRVRDRFIVAASGGVDKVESVFKAMIESAIEEGPKKWQS